MWSYDQQAVDFKYMPCIQSIAVDFQTSGENFSFLSSLVAIVTLVKYLYLCSCVSA